MSERARRLHAAARKGVFHVTGGGSLFLGEMLATPGASRTVLDVRVPYSEQALHQLLGKLQDRACSDATARALAMSAFMQARSLSSEAAFGLGCTASLATDREKKGAHRAHLALQTEDATLTLAATLSGDRATEERLLADSLWALCASLLGDDPPADTRMTRALPAWRDLVLGRKQAIVNGEHDGLLLVPGSFNPLHAGHEQMIRIAEARTGRLAGLEISIGNVDKAPLDYQEIETRLDRLTAAPSRPVWLTRAPTFIEKAAIFPDATFAVGADTILRIADARYYSNAAARDAAFDRLAGQRIRFLVFGRSLDGHFQTLASLSLPDALTRLCSGVTEDEFRLDISSTTLRNATS